MHEAGEPKVKAVFLDALERAPRERRAFVRRACDGDPALADRVGRLLDGHDRAEADPAFDRVTFTLGRVAAPADEAADVAPGLRIGHYELIEPAGRGGYASVWRARQHEPVQREVAVKLLLPDAPEGVARSAFERQALARLDHPDVARVLDAGTFRGRPYLVVELAPGVPITEFCATHDLPARERVALFGRVCGAIAHAHGRGLIHCDLKPANVLVWREDGGATTRLKVIDFGIAQAARGLADLNDAEQDDPVRGTPTCMAPEQVGGGAADVRVDVYALGLLLHAMFGGENPVARAAGSTRSRRAVMQAVEAAPRPEAVTGHLSREVNWVVERATRPDPAERFDSAAELGREARRMLEGRPLRSGPDRAGYRLGRHARRHWPVAASLLLGAVVLVGGVVATGVQAVRASRAEAAATRQRDDAEAARKQAEAALAEAEASRRESERQSEAARATSRFLQRVLFGAGLAYSDPVEAEAMARSLDRAREGLETDLREYPEVRAGLLDTLGLMYFGRNRPAEAEPLLREAWELRREVYAPDDPRTLKSLSMLANALSFQGKVDEALELNARLIELADQRGLEGDHVVRLNAELTRAELLARRGGEGDVAELAELAAAVAARMPGPDELADKSREKRMAWVLQAHTLAVAAMQLSMSDGQGGDALAHSAAALSLVRQMHDTQIDRLTVESNRGQVLLNTGRHAEAFGLLDDLLPRAAAGFGAGSLDHLVVRELRGNALAHLAEAGERDPAEAVEAGRALFEDTRGEPPVRGGWAWLKGLEVAGDIEALESAAREVLAVEALGGNREPRAVEAARAVLAGD